MNDPALLLRQLHHQPKKSLGQNFLRDPGVIAGLLQVADLDRSLPVLEIGPGLGAMTKPMLDAGFQVTALEYDAVLFQYLKTSYGERGRFILGDALTVDFGSLFTEGVQVQVLANLPYSVGTEIIFRLIEVSALFPKIVVMVQREVAQRLTAVPGSKAYGRLSIIPQNFYAIEFLKRLPGGAFEPAAAVDSDFIALNRREKPRVDLSDVLVAKTFDRLIRAAFQYRRKTLTNALKMGGFGAQAESLLRQANIDPKRRGETLSIEEFFTLARVL